MTWTHELDQAAVLATRKGYWHILLFYLLCGLAAIPTSFMVFSQVFTNATPEHWCAPPQELEDLALPDELLRNLTIPEENGVYESCRSYNIDNKTLYTAIGSYISERSQLIEYGGKSRMVKVRKLSPSTGTEDNGQTERIQDAITRMRKDPVPCQNGWKFNTEHYTRTLVTENEFVEGRLKKKCKSFTGQCINFFNKLPPNVQVLPCNKFKKVTKERLCAKGYYKISEYLEDDAPWFSLVCDKEWLPRTSNTLFWVGSIFGNVFFGLLSDRYGRRPTILLMIALAVPISIAASFPGSYWSYIALRVACGLFFPALYQQPFILALELMPPRRRTSTGIVIGMLFGSGMCLLALLAYLCRDWYYLSLATSLPFILLFGYYWFIPESPRWLVGRGRIVDAENVLRRLAKRNGIHLERGFLIEIHKRVKEEEEAEILIVQNGQIQSQQEMYEVMNRRINNMLSYKPKTIVSDLENKEPTREADTNLEIKVTEESNLNDVTYEVDKPTKTEPPSKIQTLRRKSIQLVNMILTKDREEDILERKRVDDQNSEGDCKASPLDIFRYPNIRKKFVLLTINWIAISVVYNSLSYNTSNLGVDDYLAFFIGGAVELPSYFIAWKCMGRYGRRWVLCILISIGGFACLSCALVPEDWPWITVFLAMLGRLCVAASFAVFYVQIGELLPTVLRAQAIAGASFISGVGLLACPYIVSLAANSRALPLIVMGILSLVAGVTVLFLPETLNQPLPQTLEDGELFGRDFKILSCVQVPRE